jgi:hypothetical protein
MDSSHFSLYFDSILSPKAPKYFILNVLKHSLILSYGPTGGWQRTASDLSTMQFRLIFKGHKSLEYWCLVIHFKSVSTTSYAESNGGIFILIAPLGITNTRTNVVRVICQQIIRTASD